MNVYMCVTLFSRFDGQNFLKKLKGKKVMYVGDSLSLNNFQSMVCLLHAAVPHSNITRNSKNSVTTVIFQVSRYSNESYKFAPPSELEIFFLANLELAS